MSRPNPLVLEALNTLAARGLIPSVGTRGKHIKLCWFDHGRRYVLVISRSPSDHRAQLNSRTVLRRLLRNNGTRV
jgi:hypothetical protein